MLLAILECKSCVVINQTLVLALSDHSTLYILVIAELRNVDFIHLAVEFLGNDQIL